MAMSNAAKWILGITIGLFAAASLFFLLIFLIFFAAPEDETLSTTGEKIAIVELKDVILSSDEIVRQFKKYRENKSVRAIVFRMETPGGGVSASQEIYEEVRKTRESGKPVIVSMGSVAASGGYYAACGATKIVANPGSMTGSIGVIFQFLHVGDLLNKLGIDASTYKTGRFKDSGSPLRKPSEEDSRYFDQLLADVYEQFVDVVSKERKLEKKYVKKYADGRVFTGRQALEYGFVDTLGTYQDAIDLAANIAGISGKPKIVKETKKQKFWEIILGDAFSEFRNIQAELFRQPIIQYKLLIP